MNQAVIEMDYKYWINKGEELFGTDRNKWEFVCPSCGNVQTIQDFMMKLGMTQEEAQSRVMFSCIGRWDGHINVEMCSGESPCNYTSGGLINIAPLRIICPDGKPTSAFAFNEE